MDFTDKTGAVATVRDAEDRSAYLVLIDGSEAGRAEYRDNDKDRIFYHTEVSDEFGGRGLAKGLIRQALDHTREAGKISVAVCPMVASVIEGETEKYDGWFRRPSPSDVDWLESNKS